MEEFVTWLAYHLADYWLAHGGLGQFAEPQGPITDLTGKKVTLLFTRPSEVPSSTRDIIETSAYFVASADGVFSTGWDDPTSYETIEGCIEAWWTATKSLYSSEMTFDSMRWYDAGAGVVPPQPTFRVTTVESPGTGGASMMPPQISSTMTLRTGSRRHWGRMYLPPPISTELDTGTAAGRFIHSYVDQVPATWVAAFADVFEATGLIQAVWSPAAQSFLGISAFAADDIPDTQRRRRFATIGYRAVVDS